MALRVLVVDDSSTTRKMVRRVLSMTGLSIGDVVEAPDGDEALKRIGEDEFDLVLLDVNMPRLDGMSCLSQLRDDNSHRSLPTVMVTSEASDERVQRMASLGARYVRKPFTAEDLATAIVEALGGMYGFEHSDVDGGGPDF